MQKNKKLGQVVAVDISRIEPNPAQPRVQFDPAELSALAQSIRQNGLLQPLTLRREGDRFLLIAGERRLRALKLAGYSIAPCIFVEADSDAAAMLALVENIQRQDLHFFEEAAALASLLKEGALSQQQLGERLGMAQSTVANKLRLLRFSKREKELISSLHFTERQARALLKLAGDPRFEEAVALLSQQKLTAAETERFVEQLLSGQKKSSSKKKFYPIVKDVRLFFNTINKALLLMNQSGIAATAQKREGDGCIEYLVRIPLRQEEPAAKTI